MLFSILPLALAAPLTRRDVVDWDTIVIGSGPAGIIAATRIAEAGGRTLLLEAGGPSYYVTGGTQRPSWLDNTNLSRVDVPGLYNSIFANSGNLTCERWSAAYGGCTVGGSSAINAGLWFKPPASDWDLYFPSGWQSSDVLNATQRLEQRQPSTNDTSADGIRYEQTSFDVTNDWLTRAGYTEVDLNREADTKSKVFGHPIYDYSGGQRGGPVTNYLQDALKLENFGFRTGARVMRISQRQGTADGVVLDSGEIISLAVNGRVISSAGAIQSPQLLMYSGIGPTTELSKLQSAGVLVQTMDEWIVNEAIGQGLYDNPNTFIELESTRIDSYTYSYDAVAEADAAAYVQNRTGPYTFAGQTVTFWDFINRTTDTQTDLVGLQGTVGTAGYQDYTSNHTMTLNVYGTSGLRSRGQVVLDDSLKSSSSKVLYQDPQDALDIATFIRELFDFLPDDLTPLNIRQDATIEEIRAYITTSSPYAVGQVNHWSSSCALQSCVDVNTLVIGTTNIHVVDASIVAPLTVNPQMGIMIAAEHAAQRILSM
ncbi:hypothetical protein PYCC9005_004193 [Savitreella phatthalungensis]